MEEKVIPKTVKERSNPDLLELTLQLHSRMERGNKKMHDAYIEARNELEQRLEAGQVDAVVIGLQDRIAWLSDKRDRVDGKPDDSLGGGEAFWDGRLREAQAIMNLIAKGDL